MRVAIYGRVSTRDKGQDVENQLAQLRAWAKAAGHEIVVEYVDDGISGAKGADQRPQLAALLEAAHRREFDLLGVWALDRLSREGIEAVLRYVRRLSEAGVGIHSHTESWINTSDPGQRELLIGIAGWVARMERERIAERVRAGLARARVQGTRSGRPIGGRALPAERVEAVRVALASGAGIRDTARLCGVSVGMVHKLAHP